jgi:hypothetical protein
MLPGSRSRKCEICKLSLAGNGRMCGACSDNYERISHDDGSVLEAIIWAARRARWFAQRSPSRRRRGSE